MKGGPLDYHEVRVSLVREPAHGPIAPAIRTARDIVQLLHETLHDQPQEHFVAVYLDGRHRMIGMRTVHIGTVTDCRVHPREVFLPAVHLSAVAMVLAHNHPTGDPSPSVEDRMLTERMRNAGELLGIEVLDHVVIGARAFYSFAGEAKEAYPNG